MQVNSNAGSVCCTSYRKSGMAKYSLRQKFNRNTESAGLSGKLNNTDHPANEDPYTVWMSQRVYSTDSRYVDEKEDNTGSVFKADGEEKGEFLGITMVPEKGKSDVFGMRAMLPYSSDPSDPVVQVISNLGGKEEIYNVRINKVNPGNATQLEMFALLSYMDKMGTANAGTFGSHQQLQSYTLNAVENGYCGSLTGSDTFLNGKFDWYSIIKRMMEDYQEGGIHRQYEECQRLLDYFDIAKEKQYSGKN